MLKMSFGSGGEEVYKIRIGHNEAYPGSGWYLEKVRPLWLIEYSIYM